MKLHTASRYLASLSAGAEKSSRTRFCALRDAVFSFFGFDSVDSVLLTVLGEEYSYVCRAVSASLIHAGYRVAVVNVSPTLSAEEMVTVCGKRLSDDMISEVITEVRKEAKKTIYMAKLVNNPTSPRKTRLVADLIRGLDVDKALGILQYSPRESAPKMRKLLLSAPCRYPRNSSSYMNPHEKSL